MLLAAFIVGTTNAQLSSRGIDFEPALETGRHKEGPIAALEEEINRLNRSAAFDKAALRKEIDDLRIELASRDLVGFRKVSYRSTDGLMIPAYVFEPLTPGRYPAIVDVHGGQHGSVSSRSLPRTIEWVQSGYVILAPDYRGSSGYSESYYNKADYGGEEIDDMLAAVDYLEAQPSVLKGRIGIIGGSHGGYNALMAIIRYPQRFRAAVDLFGPTDLVYRLTATPEENANTAPGDVEYFATMVGKTIKEAPELYEERSPRYLADRIKIPLLILHGENDGIVKLQESLWLVEELEKSGNTQFEFEIIEGANHGWPAELWRPAYERAKSFLDRYLASAAE
jgi:dipeptidyl aminopeptidase/acylaminoacyl peptidase